jgi:hypothetical protein
VKHVSHHDAEYLERNPFPESNQPLSDPSTDAEADENQHLSVGRRRNATEFQRNESEVNRAETSLNMKAVSGGPAHCPDDPCDVRISLT